MTLCISLRNPLQWGMASIPTSPLSSPAPYPSLLFPELYSYSACYLEEQKRVVNSGSWSCQCSIGLKVLIYSSVLICLFLHLLLYSLFFSHISSSVSVSVSHKNSPFLILTHMHSAHSPPHPHTPPTPHVCEGKVQLRLQSRILRSICSHRHQSCAGNGLLSLKSLFPFWEDKQPAVYR